MWTCSETCPSTEFKTGLKKFRGEVKGVLTRGSFISGIGNAYSDEILFAAGISPFRKVGTLKEEELERLHRQCRAVVEDAIDVLRERMGDNIHVKIRDFLKVHGKGGEPCPACGGNISQLNRQPAADELLPPLPAGDADTELGRRLIATKQPLNPRLS